MISNLESQGKLIICILPKGRALPLMEKLHKKEVMRVNFAYARGSDIHDRPGKNGLPPEVEKEIVYVSCKDSQQAEVLFPFIFEAAEMNQLGGGMIFQMPTHQCSAYLLPDLQSQEVPVANADNSGPQRPRV